MSSKAVVPLLVASRVGAAGAAGGPAPDPEAEKAAVARVVLDSICWALTQDRALQESTMAHDEDLFVLWTDSKSATTHLDEEGNDSPGILIENSTAANRAVNVPEFVNIPPDGLLKIDAPAAEFYRLFSRAAALSEKGSAGPRSGVASTADDPSACPPGCSQAAG